MANAERRRRSSCSVWPAWSRPALVNCRLAAKLHQWTTEKVQPIALELSTVRRIVTASAYMCRQRIGTSNDRPSEHSYADPRCAALPVRFGGVHRRGRPRF
jgi:hypothetical protein